MRTQVKALFRTNFTFFARKAFSELNPGEGLGEEIYLRYLCNALERVAKGETRRLVINMPPRHLKTFLGSICLPAWILAYRPTAKIMVVTHSEQLATEIAYKVRAILQSAWYRELFATRVAKDRSQVLDFATSDGGALFASTFGSRITGRGAEVIIVDDPLDIDDAANVEKIEHVNERFDTRLLSRLNNPKEGCILIIAHRLHENDLSGHVLEQGGWDHLVLPLIATRDLTYHFGSETWHRRTGELLRPDAFSASDVAHLRKIAVDPDFEMLYQQDPHGRGWLRITPEHFPAYSGALPPHAPVVLSIDPGQTGGPRNSFSVIQAWCPLRDQHLLVAQWRRQCSYSGLRSETRAFVRRHRPSAVLIEATGQGAALVSDIRSNACMMVERIVPDGRSKAARLREHAELVGASRILLPERAPWRHEFITEFVEFPAGRFDDQVDATTQYLDWIGRNPDLKKPPPRSMGAKGTGNRMFSPGQTRVFIRQGQARHGSGRTSGG